MTFLRTHIHTGAALTVQVVQTLETFLDNKGKVSQERDEIKENNLMVHRTTVIKMCFQKSTVVNSYQ
jgi:hypothetical protein